MSFRLQIATFTVLMAPGMLAAQAHPASKTRIVVAPSTTPTVQATSVTSMTASPGTISFSAADPDLGAVSGSSSATIAFDLKGGATTKDWTLAIQAGSSTFTGCTTVPASAVTATCTSATVTNVSGTAGTGACASAVTLSTTSTTVASGHEGSGKDDYTIVINFTLTDTWQNIAATSPTCPLTITYALNAP